MADKILHKRASTPGKVPMPGDLTPGELAVNTADGKLFTKRDDGAVVEVGAVPAEAFFRPEAITATTDGQDTFTVPGGYTPGAIIVALNGVTLTPADYTATNGTTVVLTSGDDVEAGAVLGVLVLAAFEVADALPLLGTAYNSERYAGLLPPAHDGKQYALQDGAWVEVEAGGDLFFVQALIVAGGAAGGVSAGNASGAGGGGGGDVIEDLVLVQVGLSFPVVVGAGGVAAASAGSGFGGNGGDSSFGGKVARGGGGGGAYTSGAYQDGLPGGSGGGGCGSGKVGGAAIGAGFPGGAGSTQTGGGGGGADEAGQAGLTATTGGKGGDGKLSSISGTATRYGGGGGAGAGAGSTANQGGLGGGGQGGIGTTVDGVSGTNGLGGGGGGEGVGSSTVRAAGNGGSGVVIVRYAGPQRATGGTVTTHDGDTIHTFNASGTFTVTS